MFHVYLNRCEFHFLRVHIRFTNENRVKYFNKKSKLTNQLKGSDKVNLNLSHTVYPNNFN